jgi:hypothetical protein
MRLPGRAPRARERNKLCVCFWEWESQKMGCYIKCMCAHIKRVCCVLRPALCVAHVLHACCTSQPARRRFIYTMNQYFGALVSISWRWHRKRSQRSAARSDLIFCILMPACCSTEVNTAVLVSAALLLSCGY